MEEWQEWYQKLKKPSWTPSGRTIGIIWAVLYPVIFVTYVLVIIKLFLGTVSFFVFAVFTFNIIANLLFSPIEFRYKNLWLASIDIVAVWASIVVLVVTLMPFSVVLALLQIPYLVWVSVAMYLQLSITIMNPNSSF